MYKIDGQKFGRLTATQETRRRFSQTLRKFICDCGNETWVSTTSVLTGHTKSCGCLVGEFAKLPSGQAVRNQILDDYKRNASKRKLCWQLKEEIFAKLLAGNCFYCNRSPQTTRHARRFNGDLLYNGIDRKDNSIGYTEENCVSCCKVCNRAKSNMTLHEFMEWIRCLKNALE